MRATTVGTGPFKPAIEHNGVTYVLDKAFPNEDSAHIVAYSLGVELENELIRKLAENMFFQRTWT